MMSAKKDKHIHGYSLHLMKWTMSKYQTYMNHRWIKMNISQLLLARNLHCNKSAGGKANILRLAVYLRSICDTLFPKIRKIAIKKRENSKSTGSDITMFSNWFYVLLSVLYRISYLSIKCIFDKIKISFITNSDEKYHYHDLDIV